MKNIFVLLAAVLALNVVPAHAALRGSPFPPEIDQRFSDIEGGTLDAGAIGTADIAAGAVTEPKLLSAATDGLNASRVARATYDVAVEGGGIGAHGLGVTLPANSIIVRTWFYVVTQFTDAGVGTVAVHCEDANNLYTATDITGMAAGVTTAGAIDGGAESTFIGSIAAACEITATVATAAQTAGKLVFFVEYFVVE